MCRVYGNTTLSDNDFAGIMRSVDYEIKFTAGVNSNQKPGSVSNKIEYATQHLTV